MTDPAVEALASILAQLTLLYSRTEGGGIAMAEDALDHIAAHLHADTPEGAALRERLGLRVERVRSADMPTDEGHTCDEGWRWWCRACNPLEQDCPTTPRVRLVSPWRDA